MSPNLALSAPAQPTGHTAPMTYAYLASASHSGSTLLACLLDGHPQISSVGEFGSEWPKEELICSCGARYHECAFWREWMELARREGIDFDVAQPNLNLQPRRGGGFTESLFYHLFPLRSLDRLRDFAFPRASRFRRHAAATIDRGVRLAEILCRTKGTDVFFDSTKNPLQIPYLARRRGLRLKVVSIVRDGRGVMYSRIKHYGSPPSVAIDVWLWQVRNQSRATAHYVQPDDLYQFRLEDFCRDPQRHLRELFGFLGVDRDVPLDCSDPSQRHITGNTMRLKFDGTIRSDESWRTKLSREHLQLFESRAGRLNRSLGYLD